MTKLPFGHDSQMTRLIDGWMMDYVRDLSQNQHMRVVFISLSAPQCISGECSVLVIRTAVIKNPSNWLVSWTHHTHTYIALGEIAGRAHSPKSIRKNRNNCVWHRKCKRPAMQLAPKPAAFWVLQPNQTHTNRVISKTEKEKNRLKCTLKYCASTVQIPRR